MDQNIFKPYIVIQQTKNYLHLAESGSRKVFLFIFFRIFPILISISIILTVVSFDFPWFIVLGLCSIIVVFIILLFQKYSIEMVISDDKAVITIQTFFGKKVETILISEVERITIQTYWLYNGGGFYYQLVLKGNQQRLPLLTIPYWYMKLKNRDEINRTLEDITELKVVKW